MQPNCHQQQQGKQDVKANVYKIGDLVLIIQSDYVFPKKSKLSSPTEGPYEIIAIHSNGKSVSSDEGISICYLPANTRETNKSPARKF